MGAITLHATAYLFNVKIHFYHEYPHGPVGLETILPFKTDNPPRLPRLGLKKAGVVYTLKLPEQKLISQKKQYQKGAQKTFLRIAGRCWMCRPGLVLQC